MQLLTLLGSAQWEGLYVSPGLLTEWYFCHLVPTLVLTLCLRVFLFLQISSLQELTPSGGFDPGGGVLVDGSRELGVVGRRDGEWGRVLVDGSIGQILVSWGIRADHLGCKDINTKAHGDGEKHYGGYHHDSHFSLSPPICFNVVVEYVLLSSALISWKASQGLKGDSLSFIPSLFTLLLLPSHLFLLIPIFSCT